MSPPCLRSSTMAKRANLPPIDRRGKRKRDSTDAPSTPGVAPTPQCKEGNEHTTSEHATNTTVVKDAKSQRKSKERVNEQENQLQEHVSQNEPLAVNSKQSPKRAVLVDTTQKPAMETVTPVNLELKADKPSCEPRARARNDGHIASITSRPAPKGGELQTNSGKDGAPKLPLIPSGGVVQAAASSFPSLSERRIRSPYALAPREAEVLANLCLPLADACREEERDRQAGLSKRINFGGKLITQSEFMSVVIWEMFKVDVRAVQDEEKV